MKGNGGRGAAELPRPLREADPHRLAETTLESALDSLGEARAAMESGQAECKRVSIGTVAERVETLRGQLDTGRSGELAANLDALCRYIGRRLLEANLYDDTGALDEVADLLRELRRGWEVVAAEVLAEDDQ